RIGNPGQYREANRNRGRKSRRRHRTARCAKNARASRRIRKAIRRAASGRFRGLCQEFRNAEQAGHEAVRSQHRSRILAMKKIALISTLLAAAFFTASATEKP